MVESIAFQRRDIEPKPVRTWRGLRSDATIHFLAIGVPLPILATLSWAKWPDAVVDFGQQLYIAWRLAMGDVLHRDIAYHHGPLAANVNALLFKIFGPHLWILIAANAVVAIVIFAAMHYLLRTGTSAWAATFAITFGICVFAFAQYVGVGNYNYLTPYVHDATHGLMWAVIMLVTITRRWSCHETGLPRDAVLTNRAMVTAGIALGMCFLTKAEIFLAAGVAAAFFLVCEPFTRLRSPSQWFRTYATFCVGFAIPPGLAFIAYCQHLPWRAAALATAGPWPAVLGGTAASNVFYVEGMGMDAPFENAWLMFVVALLWLLAWGIAIAAELMLVPRLSPMSRQLFPAASLCAVSFVVTWVMPINWFDAARGIPLLLAGAIALDVRTSVMQFRKRDIVDSAPLVRMVVGLFALTLMLKMSLNVRIYHYGFVLAMPAVLTVVAFALGNLIHGKCLASGQMSVRHAVIVGILMACAARHIQVSQRIWSEKTYSVGEGWDWFLAGPEGDIVEKARVTIPAVLNPGDDLAVMPDGVMLAYLTRRKMGMPFLYFMPNDVAVYGEEKIMRSLEECAPQAVAIIHKDTSEFGKRFFGQDYARGIATRVVEQYEAQLCIGAVPMKSDHFGILVLTKREADRGSTPTIDGNSSGMLRAPISCESENFATRSWVPYGGRDGPTVRSE